MRIILQTMLHGAQYFWAHQLFMQLAEGCAHPRILALTPAKAAPESVFSVINKYARRRKLPSLIKNVAMRTMFRSDAAEFNRKSQLINQDFLLRADKRPAPYQACSCEAEARDAIAAFGAETVVVIGSPVLSKHYFLDNVKYINLHIGRIPDYRGLKCIEWALLNQQREAIGFTVHEMTPVLDLGRVFHFERVDSEGKSLSQIYIDCYLAGITKALSIAISGADEGFLPHHKGRVYQSIDFTNLEKHRLLQIVSI